MDIDEPINNSISTKLLDIRNNMLDHLSHNKEAHFKSQQINEPDLSTEEKRKIAEILLEKNPGCFLSRFGKYILESHLEYFSELSPSDYEVNHYLRDLKSKFTISNKKKTVRNRRLEAIRRLTNEGEYFTDDEMRKRNPVMFEHFVGQYLTDEEKRSVQFQNTENQSFLGILLNAIEEREIEDRLKVETAEEEEESDSDVDMENSDTNRQKVQFWGEISSSDGQSLGKTQNIKNLPAITDTEKELLKNEFRSYVYSEFLGGKDGEFDYSKVDANHEYDDLDMLESDQQDKYFDSETPEILSKGDTSSDSSVSFDPPRNLAQKMEDLGK